MGNRYGKYKSFYVDVTIYNDDVTGSCMLIHVHRPEGDEYILIDCGVYLGDKAQEDKNFKPFLFNPNKLSAVIITHTHADHVGLLPLLRKRGYTGPIYCSDMAAALLPYVLSDNAKIRMQEAKELKKEPLFTYTDVSQTLKSVLPIPYKEEVMVAGDISVTLFKNVHVPGAAFIFLKIGSYCKQPIYLLCTGDYNCRSVFEQVEPLPKEIRELPINLIIESTYGTTDRCDECQDTFQSCITKWAEEKDTIVCFVASFERAQTVLHALKEMQDNGSLDPNIPIRIDGRNAYLYSCVFNYEFGFKNFMPVNSKFTLDPESRRHVLEYTGKQIVVTTAADACHGPAPEYVNRYIEDPNAAFMFTSYLPDDSLSKKIMQTKTGTKFFNGSILGRKEAESAQTHQFSAHARRDELMDFIKQFTNLHSVQVTHGTMEVKDSFAEYISKRLTSKDDDGNTTTIAVSGKGFALRINPCGVQKQIPMRECNIAMDDTQKDSKKNRNSRKKHHCQQPKVNRARSCDKNRNKV